MSYCQDEMILYLYKTHITDTRQMAEALDKIDWSAHAELEDCDQVAG